MSELTTSELKTLVAETIRQLGIKTPETASDITFGELFTVYYEMYALPFLKRPSFVRCFYNKHGSRWAHTPVKHITRASLQEWVNAIGRDCGQHAAAKAINTMSTILNWGIKHSYLSFSVNPCKNVTRFRYNPRERFLTPSELKRLNQALHDEPPIWRDFFLLCLLTGARKGNILSMQWDRVNFDLGIWHIPGTEHKNNESINVVLTSAALAILENRKLATGDSNWAFPNVHNASGHLGDPKRAWERITKRARLLDAHIHDLRRTRASYMAINGESELIIGKMLGHKDVRSTKIYARLNLDPVRKAAEAVDGDWDTMLSLPERSDTTIREPIIEEASNVTMIESAREAKDKRSKRTVSLDARQRVLVEARILIGLGNGLTTKKDLYRKIGGRLGSKNAPRERYVRRDAYKVTGVELDLILEDLIKRGIIYEYRDEKSRDMLCWRYALCDKRENNDQENEQLISG